MQRKTVPMKELAEIIKLQLNNGGMATLTVTGNSMLPMLVSRRDSVVLVPPGNEKKGDVVLYQRLSGQYVLHRIIEVTVTGYIISGDNQAVREPVTNKQIVAVMESFVRDGKHYSLNAPTYRLYQDVWVKLFFLRRYYFGLRRRLGKLWRRLKKR